MSRRATRGPNRVQNERAPSMADGERAGQGLFMNALVNDCFLRVRHGVRLSRSINLTWQEKRLYYIP